MQKINLPIDKKETTPTNPDFGWGFKMIIIFVSFIGITYLSFLGFSKIVLNKISLETEKEWFGDLAEGEKFEYNKVLDYKIKEFEKYNFNLSDDEEINAYAFIGGNIVINQGFLDSIENQEELVFVMAHEMAHVENRDVLKAFSTQIPMQLTLTFLGFDIGIGNSSVINIGTQFLSKETELNADKNAHKILKKYKINPLCVIPFFTRDHTKTDTVMELLSDHPLNQTRIKLLKDLAGEMGFSDSESCKKLKK